MKGYGQGLKLAATDLSNHVACRHLTSLSFAHASGAIAGGYTNFDPLLEILRERGRAHEAAYHAHLEARGLRVASGDPYVLMSQGVDVIFQAQLGVGRWQGVADFLVKVPTPSAAWGWSYEVVDTKLAADTRAGTVLQLCVYTELLAALQGATPEHMHVVKPGGFERESYRFEEYAAIYRSLAREVEARVEEPIAIATYPEPTSHCDSCNWRSRCDAERRRDDHLSLVADLGRSHQRELARHGIATLTQLAQTPRPWTIVPERGSIATYEKLRLQAVLQVTARTRDLPPYELLPVETARGLQRLPTPSPNDLFLDLEGHPYIGEHGREFLFGWTTASGYYRAAWAFDDASERAALETLLAEIERRWMEDPGMHVYHYAPYEPAALKRLVGRYALGRETLDRLLRGKRFVDLYAVVKQSARIGVESYSIKSLEALVGYQRPVPLEVTNPAHRLVKLSLQRGVTALDTAWLRDVEAYNRGDCEAAAAVRTWLEARRAEANANGILLERPPLLDGRVEEITETHTHAALLAQRLLDGVPIDGVERTTDQQARWLLGHLMEWHRREDAVTWWEFFRLAQASDDDRLDELRAVAGLEHVERTTPRRGNPIDRYRFPDQDCQLRVGDKLRTSDADDSDIGSLVAIDLEERTLEIKRTKKTLHAHPTSAFSLSYFAPGAKQTALLEIGGSVVERGIGSSLACDLLLRRPPAGIASPFRREGEDLTACAIRLATTLDGGVLPFQGPPGTGKTHTAAELILALVGKGKRVGVTAASHAVIENLVTKTAELAAARGQPMRIAIKSDDVASRPDIEYIADPKEAARRMPSLDLLGATCWQWAHDDMRNSVDALIIDEAGQLCLADALAVTVATRNLVLVGDPQQLEQPIQGTHPDGVAVSVLQHMIGAQAAIAPERGVLLDTTYRMHPTIAGFTSEQFYMRRLRTAPEVTVQQIAAPPLVRSGLYWLPVAHEGNQNSSTEEADAVVALIEAILRGTWQNARGVSTRLDINDILVVAPYNAHVTTIRQALGNRGPRAVRVGTVDKFQGRQAAVAIYAMATSLPEDAPRGLGFLYDRHRFNVATSRARCASVLVASPALLRPTCATPRQLHLASALARFVELATPIALPSPASDLAGADRP